MKGYFITGTDTGVGKTIVTASLCRCLRQRGIDAVAVKPFATGITTDSAWQENDPMLLAAAMDFEETAEVISPVRLQAPLSPYDSAMLSNTTIDIEAVLEAVRSIAARHDVVLVEGVGGVAVPLTENCMVSDFAARLGLPAILVARSRVGTINHTLLTVAALRQSGVIVDGVVFNRSQRGDLALDEQIGPVTACRLATVANFGLLEFAVDIESAESVEAAALVLPVNDPTIAAMADHVVRDMI